MEVYKEICIKLTLEEVKVVIIALEGLKQEATVEYELPIIAKLHSLLRNVT